MFQTLNHIEWNILLGIYSLSQTLCTVMLYLVRTISELIYMTVSFVTIQRVSVVFSQDTFKQA